MTVLHCDNVLLSRIHEAQSQLVPMLLLFTPATPVTRQEDSKATIVMLQVFAYNKPPLPEEPKLPSKISFTPGSQIPSKLVIDVPESFITRSNTEPLLIDCEEEFPSDELDEELPDCKTATLLDVFVNALSTHEHPAAENFWKGDCQACKDRYCSQLIVAGELSKSSENLSELFFSCAAKSAEFLNLSPDLETNRTDITAALKRRKIGSPSSRSVSVTARETPAGWKKAVLRVLSDQPYGSGSESPIGQEIKTPS